LYTVLTVRLTQPGAVAAYAGLPASSTPDDAARATAPANTVREILDLFTLHLSAGRTQTHASSRDEA
jgi:hypothetical protein